MTQLFLKKFDEELQIVYGEVYAPGFPDSQGDFMTVREVQKMAHSFMRKNRVSKIDVQHDNVDSGAIIVESFIARKGDPDFLEGAWVVGVHIPDTTLWVRVKKGELNGFSLQGPVMSREQDVEIEVPEEIVSKTDTADGHVHEYRIKFAEDGAFLGGSTDEINGHSHKIIRGTITEPADGHTHRYSFLESLAA